MGRPSFDTSTGERVSEVIRERLAVLGLNASDLARRAEFDPSQMSKIILGKGGTDLPGWKRIAIALDLAPADFFARVFPTTVVRRPSRRSRNGSPQRSE